MRPRDVLAQHLDLADVLGNGETPACRYRLNSNMPVWHISASISDPTRTRRVRSVTQVERAAVAALAGVGGVREWWWWNRDTGVGHLRVSLTGQEKEVIGDYPAEHDAGPTGPERPRTPARR